MGHLHRYTSDLNACAEFESALTEEDYAAYCDALNVTSGADANEGEPSFVAYFASACQRADAFLLAVGYSLNAEVSSEPGK